MREDRIIAVELYVKPSRGYTNRLVSIWKLVIVTFVTDTTATR